MNGKNVRLIDLDIRGPWYNKSSTNSTRPKTVFCGHYGVNASSNASVHDGFQLIRCSVNGFNSHGVYLAVNKDIVIRECQINYNAQSGVVSFGGMNPGEAIELLDNDLSNNGENGYDGIASRVEAIGNISNLNGWIWPANVDCSSSDTHGEGHGLLFQAATVEICDLIVSGNECAYNRRNGIYLAGGAQTGYRNARISNNTVQNNGTEQSAACVGYGVRLGTNLQQPWCPPAQVTPMLEVVFISNVGGGNYDGNWNLPYPGVSESQHPIPQNVVATDTSRCEGGTQIHEITLTWTNPTQDKLIQIWRDGQHIRNASAGTTQFVNKVGPCAQHWYELRYEIDPGVFGPFSNFAAAQTPFNPCNPSQQCQ